MLVQLPAGRLHAFRPQGADIAVKRRLKATYFNPAIRFRSGFETTQTVRFAPMPQVAFSKSTTLSTRSALTDDFYQLAGLVRRSKPETVVLVARKMPRLCSALSLDFGEAHVISDMAIPLSESILRGRRVAIVDDFINAGSTIDRALRKRMSVFLDI